MSAPPMPSRPEKPVKPSKPVDPYSENIQVLSSVKGVATEVFIEQYGNLGGCPEGSDVKQITAMKKAGLKLKRLKVVSNNGSFRAEAGALHYMIGNLKISADTGGVGGFMKKAIKAKMSGESAVKPKYDGTGTAYMEPVFSFYELIQVHNDMVILDKGLYFASEDTVEVGVFKESGLMMKSAGSGSESRFKTKLTGSGWCVLELEVPQSEVQKIKIPQGQELRVDGYFAIVRKGDIAYSVSGATSSKAGSAVSGEGNLCNYVANGPDCEVWLCPTLDSYPEEAEGEESHK